MSTQQPRGAPPRSTSDGESKQARVVEITPRTVLIALGLTALVFLLIGIIAVASRAVILILLGVFFTLALSPAVAFFQRRGLGRGWSVAVVAVLVVLALVILGFVFVPPLVTQVRNFVIAAPRLFEQTASGAGPLGFLERDFQVVERIRQQTAAGGHLIETAAPAVASSVISTVTGVVVVFFLTLFMLLEGGRWVQRLLDLVPADKRPRWERVASGVYRVVTGFVSGSVVAAIAGGAVALIVLVIVGAPYPVPLALLTALLEVIPILGPVLATAALSLAALTQGIVPGLVVLGIFTLYHGIEGHTLRPLVYGRTVRLSPLAVLISILVGTELGGVLGAIGAIPVGGSIAVLLNELLPGAADDEQASLDEDAEESPADDSSAEDRSHEPVAGRGDAAAHA